MRKVFTYLAVAVAIVLVCAALLYLLREVAGCKPQPRVEPSEEQDSIRVAQERIAFRRGFEAREKIAIAQFDSIAKANQVAIDKMKRSLSRIDTKYDSLRSRVKIDEEKKSLVIELDSASAIAKLVEIVINCDTLKQQAQQTVRSQDIQINVLREQITRHVNVIKSQDASLLDFEKSLQLCQQELAEEQDEAFYENNFFWLAVGAVAGGYVMSR